MKQLLIAIALVSANAMADETTGFYVGGTVGQAEFDVSKYQLGLVVIGQFDSTVVATLPGAYSTLDDQGQAWSLAAGYRISPYFSVEVGYLDLGTAKYRATIPLRFAPPGTPDISLGIDCSSKGPTVRGIAALPLGDKFDIHGHLGTFFANTTIEANIGRSRFNQPESADRSQDFFAGIGAAFHFTKSFALSLDYSAYKDVGGDDTGEGDVNSIRLGVEYGF